MENEVNDTLPIESEPMLLEEDTPEEPQQTLEQPKTEEKPAPTMEDVMKELEFLKKQYQESQSFIGKQSNIIGQLKKQVEVKNVPPPKKLDLDTFVSDPEAAIRQEIERREQDRVEKQRQEEETIQSNVATVLQKVPNFDSLIDTIMEIASNEDGIQGVTRDMVINTARLEPAMAIQFAKRALMKQQYEGKANSTTKALNNAQKMSQTAPKPKTGVVSTGKKSYTVKEMRSMSDAELEAALKEIK